MGSIRRKGVSIPWHIPRLQEDAAVLIETCPIQSFLRCNPLIDCRKLQGCEHVPKIVETILKFVPVV